MAQAIPDGQHTITPYLVIDGAAKAIEFYKRAFGAKERMRMDTPMGTIGHAEIEIGDSVLMLADPMPQRPRRFRPVARSLPSEPSRCSSRSCTARERAAPRSPHCAASSHQ